MSEKRKEATALYNRSKLLDTASGFAGIGSSMMDYSLMNIKSDFQQNVASSIELQAKERANLLRERFLESAGNAVTTAAMRGQKVGTGSIARNLEQSSIDLGKDISKMEENALARANLMRTQSSINKKAATGNLVSGLMMGGSKIYSGGLL